jgi:hypothetical protein
MIAIEHAAQPLELIRRSKGSVGVFRINMSVLRNYYKALVLQAKQGLANLLSALARHLLGHPRGG